MVGLAGKAFGVAKGWMIPGRLVNDTSRKDFSIFICEPNAHVPPSHLRTPLYSFPTNPLFSALKGTVDAMESALTM